MISWKHWSQIQLHSRNTSGILSCESLKIAKLKVHGVTPNLCWLKYFRIFAFFPPGAHSPLYAGQASWPCLVPADSALWGPRGGRGDLEEQQEVSGEGETTDEH